MVLLQAERMGNAKNLIGDDKVDYRIDRVIKRIPALKRHQNEALGDSLIPKPHVERPGIAEDWTNDLPPTNGFIGLALFVTHRAPQ